MKGVIRGERYYLENQEVTKAIFDLAFPDLPLGGEALSATPANISESLAVHPKQVQEAVADAKAKGVPTEFLPDGRPVFTSRAHQKAYLKAYNFRNNDGSYGD